MAIWLDLDALGEYLKIPISTLYKLAQRGAIPGHKVGRTWRFDRDEVDNWIKAGRKQEPVSQGSPDRVTTSKANKAS
jgi:excisionase family DNA binding protein